MVERYKHLPFVPRRNGSNPVFEVRFHEFGCLSFLVDGRIHIVIVYVQILLVLWLMRFLSKYKVKAVVFDISISFHLREQTRAQERSTIRYKSRLVTGR